MTPPNSQREPPPDTPPVDALLADLVARFCADRFAEAERLAALVTPALATASPRRADLGIDEDCRDLLELSDPPLAGAGVVVAPHVLGDEPYCLQWWLAGPDERTGAATLLAADMDPASVTFRDYTSLAWFAEPARTFEPCVTGPYVDYLCTDQYTLTFTVPLVAGDRFLGVAGVDVLARWCEQHLLTVLDPHPATSDDASQNDGVVVNRNGRVLACPSGAWVTGDLVRDLDGPDWHTTACPGTPFRVARPVAATPGA